MSERTRKQKPAPQEREAETPHAEAPAKRDPEAQEKIDAMDELLDEIDGILEENAEEFVRNYKQMGGE